jgi:FlaA1/EpsC-like NDP-sugar epimerase
MGEPVRIVDLARDLIALSGLREKDDIDIVFTGMRPGEKLFEELATHGEGVDKTRHPKIFVGKLQKVPSAQVQEHLQQLREHLQVGKSAGLLAALRRLVPEYETHPSKPVFPEAKSSTEGASDAELSESVLVPATVRQ